MAVLRWMWMYSLVFPLCSCEASWKKKKGGGEIILENCSYRNSIVSVPPNGSFSVVAWSNFLGRLEASDGEADEDIGGLHGRYDGKSILESRNRVAD